MLGRYQLQSLLGRGGFGEVWKAYDPELQRLVAVKIPRLDRRGEPCHAAKFLYEARKVARLKHAGIVPVYDVGQDGNVCFIVSEFVPGENLAELMKKQRLNFNASPSLIAGVADALDYSHRQGFVHRDVKPQNIIIDESGRPRLTDFGIALTEDQPVHERSTTSGTLAYTSPEQAQSQTERIDARTDTYSLGVVFYELLTGRLPFVADGPMNLWASIVSSSPRPLRTIEPLIPLNLERICLKALAKKPEDRFSTAGDFADELRAAIVQNTEATRWPKWIAVSAALVVLLGVGVLMWANRQASSQADRPSQPFRGRLKMLTNGSLKLLDSKSQNHFQ